MRRISLTVLAILVAVLTLTPPALAQQPPPIWKQGQPDLTCRLRDLACFRKERRRLIRKVLLAYPFPSPAA